MSYCYAPVLVLVRIYEIKKIFKNNKKNECGPWIHEKCLNMSTSTFKYFLERPTIEWTCPLCSLPRLGDSFFLEDEEIMTTETM